MLFGLFGGSKVKKEEKGFVDLSNVSPSRYSRMLAAKVLIQKFGNLENPEEIDLVTFNKFKHIAEKTCGLKELVYDAKEKFINFKETTENEAVEFPVLTTNKLTGLSIKEITSLVPELKGFYEDPDKKKEKKEDKKVDAANEDKPVEPKAATAAEVEKYFNNFSMEELDKMFEKISTDDEFKNTVSRYVPAEMVNGLIKMFRNASKNKETDNKITIQDVENHFGKMGFVEKMDLLHKFIHDEKAKAFMKKHNIPFETIEKSFNNPELVHEMKNEKELVENLKAMVKDNELKIILKNYMPENMAVVVVKEISKMIDPAIVKSTTKNSDEAPAATANDTEDKNETVESSKPEETINPNETADIKLSTKEEIEAKKNIVDIVATNTEEKVEQNICEGVEKGEVTVKPAPKKNNEKSDEVVKKEKVELSAELKDLFLDDETNNNFIDIHEKALKVFYEDYKKQGAAFKISKTLVKDLNKDKGIITFLFKTNVIRDGHIDDPLLVLVRINSKLKKFKLLEKPVLMYKTDFIKACETNDAYKDFDAKVKAA